MTISTYAINSVGGKESAKARMIEKILLAEYELALADLEGAMDGSRPADEVDAVCKRYIRITKRLQKFYSRGEVPADVAAKIRRKDAWLPAPIAPLPLHA